MLNSPVDLAIVFGIALLVFGPKKLPELGKSLGQGIGNFKRSLQDAQDQVKNAVNTDEKPATAAKEEGAALKKEGGSCCGGDAHTHKHEDEKVSTG
jgi:sec-independent protein translocase protein TatA